MQLKALAAILSVACTIGVQAAPNPLDRAADMKGILRRSYSHGRDMSEVSKRAVAMVAKKRDSNQQRRRGKQCKSKTTPTDPAPQPQQPQTTPAPEQPQSTPAPDPEQPQPNPTPDPGQPETSPAPSQPQNPQTTEPATLSNSPQQLVADPTSSDDNNNNNDDNNNNNSGSGSTSPDSEVQEWLDSHNAARAQHGANNLTWDGVLAAYAQEHAEKCVWEHSGGKYGENMAGGGTPSDSVNMWMDEAKDYDPNNPKFEQYHFTQVVWKGTKRLGCAMVECNAGALYEGKANGATAMNCVCEYDPPGNYDGQFGENVQK